MCLGPKGRNNLFSSDRAECSCPVCVGLKSGSIVHSCEAVACPGKHPGAQADLRGTVGSPWLIFLSMSGIPLELDPSFPRGRCHLPWPGKGGQDECPAPVPLPQCHRIHQMPVLLMPLSPTQELQRRPSRYCLLALSVVCCCCPRLRCQED